MQSLPLPNCGTLETMGRAAACIVLALGWSVAAACSGPENSFYSPDDQLGDAPRYGERREDASAPAPNPSPSSGSSSSSGAGGPPANPDSGTTPTCGALWALTAAEVVPGLPAVAIRPTFSSDELSAYFVQPNASNQYRIYAATRPALGQAFGAAVEMGPNINASLHSLAVSLAPAGLELVFNNYDGSTSQLLHTTRASLDGAFGPASLVRANAILEVAARDDSARFFARNVAGSTMLFQLRPGNAPETEAQILRDGVPTWYEPESGTLWLEQFSQQPSPAFYPRTAHWDGAAWGDSIPTDLRVYWISLDGCRVYGVNELGVVVRQRVISP